MCPARDPVTRGPASPAMQEGDALPPNPPTLQSNPAGDTVAPCAPAAKTCRLSEIGGLRNQKVTRASWHSLVESMPCGLPVLGLCVRSLCAASSSSRLLGRPPVTCLPMKKTRKSSDPHTHFAEAMAMQEVLPFHCVLHPLTNGWWTQNAAGPRWPSFPTNHITYIYTYIHIYIYMYIHQESTQIKKRCQRPANGPTHHFASGCLPSSRQKPEAGSHSCGSLENGA